MKGYSYTNGRVTSMDPQDFAHARLILLWGTNTLTSNMHLWPFVQSARKQGARVIVIDPARTRAAQSELGRVQLTARVTDDIIPSTVLAPGIWWNKLSAQTRGVSH